MCDTKKKKKYIFVALTVQIINESIINIHLFCNFKNFLNLIKSHFAFTIFSAEYFGSMIMYSRKGANNSLLFKILKLLSLLEFFQCTGF